MVFMPRSPVDAALPLAAVAALGQRGPVHERHPHGCTIRATWTLCVTFSALIRRASRLSIRIADG
jgi:hypothetical protein